MSNPWFRLYAEFAHDPKIQMLSEAMQRRYIMIMCMRCSNALVTLHETEIAFHLRVTDAELAETKALFISKGFIDDKWSLINWEKRQFVSDSSAPRVAKHRQKIKEASNADVTLQKRQSNVVDTDTDTDIKHIAPAKADVFSFKAELLKLGADPVLVSDWLKVRVAKKARNTKTALDGFLREVKKSGFTYDQALRRCCEKNWSGFEAEWVANIKPPTDTTAIPFDREAYEADKKAALARMREEDAKYTVPPLRLQA